MKNAILVVILLMASIFAGAFALAGAENAVTSSSGAGAGGSSVSVKSNTAMNIAGAEEGTISISEIDATKTEKEDIEASLQEVGEVKGYKKTGFAKVWRGHGWISDNEKGYLISGFWASQKFAKNDVSNKEIKDMKTIRSYGILRIVKNKVYRLIMAQTTEEIENANSVSFYVIPLNKKKYLKESDLSKDAIGKLVLNKKEQFKGLATWCGTLSFEEGNLKGSWDVELGTEMNVIKPEQAKKIRAIKGKVQKARVRINEVVSISPSESSGSEAGYVGAEEETSVEAEEIHIKPVKIKRQKFLFIIPTGKKFLEVEVTKAGKAYKEKISANEAKQIEDYTVSVGSLEDEENIELNVE